MGGSGDFSLQCEILDPIYTPNIHYFHLFVVYEKGSSPAILGFTIISGYPDGRVPAYRLP
jgi:hypothetical protein